MTMISYDSTQPLPKLEPVPDNPLARCRSLVLAGTALVGVFIAGFGVWSAYAPLESAAMAPGMVVAESSRKTIQHLEGGIIAEILVKDGDQVKAGQTLVRLDDTKARTTLLALKGQLWDGRAREARLFAERDQAAQIAFPSELLQHRDEPAVAAAIAGQQKIFETRRSLLQSKIDATRERINQVREEIVGHQAEEAAAQRRLVLIAEEIKGVQELVAKGLERKPRLLQLQRDLADIEGRRGDIIAQIAKARQTIAESEVNILTIRNDSQKEVADELRETQKKLHEQGEQAEAAANVMARTDIKAPEDGVVTDLKVHTPGGVINQGEPLMDLVPSSDRLVIEAQVRPEDIDRVHEGLPAQVRLLPYKQRRTPPFDATVTYVSADRLIDKKNNQPYFAARLRLDEKQLAQAVDVTLVPGMPSESMIKTGETTVALYALSPILDSFHRSFREK
jgi:HlyD family secretion protein